MSGAGGRVSGTRSSLRLGKYRWDIQKKIGYRFTLRKLEYPRSARAGSMAEVHMWWFNAGTAPVYRDYTLAVQLKSAVADAVIGTSANVRS